MNDADRLRLDLWYLDEALVEQAVATPDAVMIEVRFNEAEGPGPEPMPLPENSPKFWRMN